ncbi:hypothetical protein BKA82DRAFT_4354838 [Pisolithus tinctorius]|nr:hypothetical protein BKA82DRAFT_4354838 [Pisolithus tinctorius]
MSEVIDGELPMANFQYHRDAELPLKVQESIQCASPLELMLVAASWATVITHHYQTKSIQGGHVPEEASQHFNRGNVTLLPQELTGLSDILPPMWSNLCGAVCMVFAGGAFCPTAEALHKFPPVLVIKSRVKSIIEWLISNNKWYMKKGIMFSEENLTSLVTSKEDTSVLWGIEITHLCNEDGLADANGSVDWSALVTDLVMESVAYTDGDHSECLWQAMKATALAHALSHKKFIVSCSGLELLNENSPGFLTMVFPHLDPWGIGGFNHPA